MNNLDGNITPFNADQEPHAHAACETCGAAKYTGSVCRTCAIRLIDIALSSIDAHQTSTFLGGQDFPTTFPVRRFYDHYEVCLTDEDEPMELGRGAMGITYKAIDIHLGCPVALKIVRTGSLTDSAAAKRLLQEARAAAQLRHPNIASIHHLGLGDEQCYYSMEYIEGGNFGGFRPTMRPFTGGDRSKSLFRNEAELRGGHEPLA